MTRLRRLGLLLLPARNSGRRQTKASHGLITYCLGARIQAESQFWRVAPGTRRVASLRPRFYRIGVQTHTASVVQHWVNLHLLAHPERQWFQGSPSGASLRQNGWPAGLVGWLVERMSCLFEWAMAGVPPARFCQSWLPTVIVVYTLLTRGRGGLGPQYHAVAAAQRLLRRRYRMSAMPAPLPVPLPVTAVRHRSAPRTRNGLALGRRL